MNKKTLLLAFALALPSFAWAETGQQKGERIYRSVCYNCHDAGLVGAPKIGDVAAWRPRLAEGQKTLTRMALQGIRKMPSRGGIPSLEDDEVAAAVAWIANQSGGKFKYPD